MRPMYAVHNDTRIFLTPVSGFDARTGTYLRAAQGQERVFPDERALIRYLARFTETYGKDDPARWYNPLIVRQFSAGREAREWEVKTGRYYGGKTGWNHWFCDPEGRPVDGNCDGPRIIISSFKERWDYWFHDAQGRTVDVRRFWPQVVKAVRGGDTADASTVNRKAHCSRQRQTRHRVHRHGRKGVYAFYRRLGEETFLDDEDGVIGTWKPRGRLITAAYLMGDWDYFDMRACRSAGWKNQKCAHQWEHNVREKEKHDKNRQRKARRMSTI